MHLGLRKIGLRFLKIDYDGQCFVSRFILLLVLEGFAVCRTHSGPTQIFRCACGTFIHFGTLEI